MHSKTLLESLESKIQALKKKNEMFQDENQMLRRELKVLCENDTNMASRYSNDEINRLQREVKQLKSDKNLLEIQLNNINAEQKHRDSRKQAAGTIFDDVDFRFEYNSIKNQLEAAKRRIKELEDHDKSIRYGSIKEESNDASISSYIQKMKELENENDRLKRQINYNPNAINSLAGGNELLLQRQINEYEQKVAQLKEEIKIKDQIIKRLNKGESGNDLEAIENLRKVNERLMQNIIQLQEQLNQSYLSKTNQGTGRTFTNPGKGSSDLESDPLSHPRPNVVQSSFIDEDEFMAQQKFGRDNDLAKSSNKFGFF